ncbi:MAG: mannose-6-phosphate isomerase, class I [Desulfobacteraceae bacterium]|nr:mannose-6-phosphate isomerase, class I [Desulfobacteraceae bacterium]MBC2718559.1 mannose-6-phosphate isomerase, class I [Desulfobacteraceae bacterium]
MIQYKNEKICLMKNTIQEYAWGSHTAIADLVGNNSPSTNPQAELWMGAHPKAPSLVKYDDKWLSLLELIKQSPADILGKDVAAKFDNKLPFLFKVLAASKPLSIQAHPSIKLAKQGFEKENRLGIPIDSPNRNYKDENHKPECICALTPFLALYGFRKISEIIFLMEKICLKVLYKELNNLKKQPNSNGLKNFFRSIITINGLRKKQIIEFAITNAQKLSEVNPIFKWMIKLYKEYPDDMGIFAPILLNLISLKPGQAIFLSSGELHAYLNGLGVELMANSDNVLRGGLTKKHIDIPELLNVLNFEVMDVNILLSQKDKNCEGVYHSMAEEFVLSVISDEKNISYTSPEKRSVEIILCTDGKASITDISIKKNILLKKGTSVIIPSLVNKYRIEGKATLYKASAPV